jgi:DnaD/phage-associated family protein
MAEFRQLHTSAWTDRWFLALPSDEKLLFIYLFTNARASVSGLYELPLAVISFETRLAVDVIENSLKRFVTEEKIRYDFNEEVIFVINMFKYQGSSSPKLLRRIKKDIDSVPECELKSYAIDTLSIPYDYGNDTTVSVSVSVSDSVSVKRDYTENEIFTFYEENITKLKPAVKTSILKTLSKGTPPAWVMEAISIAAEKDKNTWSYISGIIANWNREGKDNGVKGKNALPAAHSVYDDMGRPVGVAA